MVESSGEEKGPALTLGRAGRAARFVNDGERSRWEQAAAWSEVCRRPKLSAVWELAGILTAGADEAAKLTPA